jgi:hypothetical protein
MDAIKMLISKHPAIALCIVCLALYGLSTLFCSRDQEMPGPEYQQEEEESEPKKSQKEQVKAAPKK